MEISLKDMVELFLKRMLLIVVTTLLFIVTSFSITKFVIKPTYTAIVQMYVNPNTSASFSNINDLTYAQKVVNTYINFLQTKVFFKEVIEKSNLNYTVDQLKSMTEIQAVNNTEIFEIRVTTLDPNDSYLLVKAMEETAPSLIKNIKYSAEISVVDPVTVPVSPSGPSVLKNTMFGGILGLMLSLLVSFLWEVLDVKIKNQEDLIKRHKVTILGIIPAFYNRANKRLFPTFQSVGSSAQQNTMYMDENHKFIIGEAYKSLRTNLFVTVRHGGCKKVLVTSTMPEEGKSTTTMNLGIAIAQTGLRVLLMDCDLRKGTLHEFFNIRRRPGISDVLTGQADLKSCVIGTEHGHLKILAMGTIYPNPSELLASELFHDILKVFEMDYDYILIDTPPVNVVSDGISLSKLVDGIVLVIREGVTTHPNLNTAIHKLEFAEANILGVVLNGVNIENGKKAGYYYYVSHESGRYD